MKIKMMAKQTIRWT